MDVDDKVLLEHYRLEKDFDGAIELESTEGGFAPITGEAGRREQKKDDPLTVLIDKINDRYSTNFTEMDKVLVQMENDYASQEKWQNYAEKISRHLCFSLLRTFLIWPQSGMSRMTTSLSGCSLIRI